MSKIGIEKITALVVLGAAIGMKAADALEDKKITLPEAFGFLPDLMAIPGIINDFPAIKQEIADLDPNERAEIAKVLQDKFDIANDKLEAVIEGGVRLALALLDEIALFKGLRAE